MEKVGLTLFFIDTLFIFLALRKIYHSMFHVYHFTLASFVKELIITLILAGVLLMLPIEQFEWHIKESKGLGLTWAGLIYLSVILLISIVTIVILVGGRSAGGSSSE